MNTSKYKPTGSIVVVPFREARLAEESDHIEGWRVPRQPKVLQLPRLVLRFSPRNFPAAP